MANSAGESESDVVRLDFRMQASILSLVALLALNFNARALDVPPDLRSIQQEVRVATARERTGHHNRKFTAYFDHLQTRFTKPKPDNDWRVDPYMLVGAVRIIVDRARLSTREQRAAATPDRAYAIFRRQLEHVYRHRLHLSAAIANDLARGMEAEAREVAGLSFGEKPVPSFKTAALLLLESSRFHDRCQVPFIAGYGTKAGSDVYIDRDVPRSFDVNGKSIPVFTLINLHERIEKALMDEYRLVYQHAHQIALRSERMAAEGLRAPWSDYDDFIVKMYDRISKREVKWIDTKMDQRPYLSYHDLNSYKLVQAIRKRAVDSAHCPPRSVE